MLSSTRPTVVFATFNSWMRPVIPALRRTSFAINYFGKAIIASDRSKSNGFLESILTMNPGENKAQKFISFPPIRETRRTEEWNRVDREKLRGGTARRISVSFCGGTLQRSGHSS